MTDKRTLETMHSKFWTFRGVDGAFIWGMSRDWLSLTPWTDSGRKLPYIGVDKIPYEGMSRRTFLFGPFLFQICWVKDQPHD